MPVKVLIAHNNIQRLKQAVTDLHAAGFDVVATPDGGDAFARFFEEEPEVVICSQVLPSLNGDNIARMVRAQSPETQMVLLTENENVTVEDGVKVMLEPLTLAKLREALPDIAFEAPSHSEDTQADLTAASPTRVFVHAVLKRFQRDNRALQSLDDAGIGKMAAIAENRNFQENELIIRQGDPGDGFYLVCEGQVKVTLAEKEDKEVARISAGGFFGEMAMLLDQKRSASVWSVGPTTLLWFGKSVFMPILLEYPGMREVLSGVALKRTEENLWRVLFDDDEVQRSLAQLDEANQAAQKAAVVEEDVVAPRNVAPSEVKKIDKPPFTKTIRPSAVLVSPAEVEKISGLRGLFNAHRFEAGVGAGFVAGVLLMALIGLAGSSGDAAVKELSPPVVSKPAVVATPVAVEKPAVEKPAAEKPGVAPASAPVEADNPRAAPASAPVGVDKPAVVPAKVAVVAEVPTAAPPEAAPVEKKGNDVETAIAINEAYKANDYKKIVSLAKKMSAPDADSAYIIADARRHLGQPESLQAYLDFTAQFPTHNRADDAQFWAAELLSQAGKKDEARVLYQKVAENEKSNFRTSAAKRLDGK